MERLNEDLFSQWFRGDSRSPLLIRGVRQVGKSWITSVLGARLAKKVHVIDFELIPEARFAFDSPDPPKIIANLEVILGQKIESTNTLLFLDEIQLCPKAIVALRYFKEKMPALAVVAAGSLLEFALKRNDFSFPVGRISFLFMRPMTFKEFLLATNEEPALRALTNATVSRPCSQSIHVKLLSLVQDYFQIGGMPAVVDSYAKSKSWLKARELQSTLIQSYRLDFPKYAKQTQIEHLEKCFQKAPSLIGQTLKYVNFDRDARALNIKTALEQLEWAGLIHRVHAVTGDGLPLAAHAKDRPGKIILHDIGIMQASLGGPMTPSKDDDITGIYRGAIAEQFVGQELVALAPQYEPAWLAYWERSALNSQAEVDYVMTIDSKVIPLEVKSGKSGRLKSLHLFMQEKKTPIGLRVSSRPLELEGQILSVPFYMVSEIPRLL